MLTLMFSNRNLGVDICMPAIRTYHSICSLLGLWLPFGSYFRPWRGLRLCRWYLIYCQGVSAA
jgi:hypothetical protein